MKYGLKEVEAAQEIIFNIKEVKKGDYAVIDELYQRMLAYKERFKAVEKEMG